MNSTVRNLSVNNRISLLHIFMALALLMHGFSGFCQGSVKYMINIEYSILSQIILYYNNGETKYINFNNTDSDINFTVITGYDEDYMLYYSEGNINTLERNLSMNYITIISNVYINSFEYVYNSTLYTIQLNDQSYNKGGNWSNATGIRYRCTYWVDNYIWINSYNSCSDNLILSNCYTYSMNFNSQTFNIRPYFRLDVTNDLNKCFAQGEYTGQDLKTLFDNHTLVNINAYYFIDGLTTGMTPAIVSRIVRPNTSYKLNINATFTPSQPKCSGDKGSITINVSAPQNTTINYDYCNKNNTSDTKYRHEGSFNSSPYTVSVHSGVTYKITLSKDDYCPKEDTIVINPAPPALNINASTVSATCSAKDDGSITITPSGGTPPYTLEVFRKLHQHSLTGTRKNAEFSFIPNKSGNFIVAITLSPVDQHTDSIVVYENNRRYFKYPGSTINISAYNFDLAVTQGANYKIDFRSNTDFTSISFQVYEPYYSVPNVSQNSSKTISNLYAGEYSLRLTDNNGCVKESIVNLPTAAINSRVNSVNPTCSSLNNGSISVTTGTNRSLDLYFNGQTVSQTSFSNLPAGDYSIRLQNSDATCIFLDTTITLSYSKEPQLNMYTYETNSPICYNAKNGQITVKKNNGYDLNGIILNDSLYNSSSVTELLAGAYKIKVKTTDNCITTSDTSINITSYEPLTVGVTSEPVRCNGEKNGSVKFLNPNGGADGKYSLIFESNSYSIDTSLTISDLSAGDYIYRLTDRMNCSSDTLKVWVEQPNELSLLLTPTFYFDYHVPCADDKYGVVTALASGGNGSYKYILQDSLRIQNHGYFDSIETNRPYTFKVVDQKGCDVQKNITLDKIPSPLRFGNIAISNYNEKNIRCNGDNSGKIYLTIDGGVRPYHIMLEPNTGIIHGSDSITNLKAGTYKIAVFDANDCVIDTSVTLTQPEPIALVVNPKEYHGYHIPCKGNNVTISAEAEGGIKPYMFTWNNISSDTSSQFALGAGWHTVKVTDRNGCFRTHTFELTEPDRLSVSIDSTKPPTCWYDCSGYIAVSVSGGISADTLKYALYTDNFNNLWVDSGVKQNNLVFDQLPGRGDYAVKVTDLNGCIASVSPIDIIQHDTIQLQILKIDSVSCYGGNNGQIAVSVGRSNNAVYPGDFSYYLDNVLKQAPANTLFLYAYDGLSAGYYQVAVKDKNSCYIDTIVSVPEPSKMELMPDIVPNICYGDNKASLTITAKGGVGGYKFAYTVLSTATDPLRPSDHNFMVTRPDNVLKLDSLNWNVTHREEPQYFFIYLKDRNYVEDQSTCIVSTLVTLPRKMPIKDTLIYHSPQCFGQSDGEAVIKIIGGGNGNPENWKYKWKDGEGNEVSNNDLIQNLSSGRYSVWVQDSLGCTLERSFVLQEPGVLTASLVSTTPYSYTNKSGGSATLLVQLPDNISTYRYALDTLPMMDGGGLQLILNNLSAGKHTIRFNYNNNLCQALDSFYIAYARLYIDTVYRSAAGKGASNGYARVVAKEGDGRYTYLWYRNNGATYELMPHTGYEITNLPAGRYRVRVVDGQQNTSDIREFTIDETEQFNIILWKTQPATCTNATDGLAIVSVGGARLYPPYRFEWKNNRGQVVGTDSILIAGTGKYIIKVTDASGSVDSMNVTLGVRIPINFNGSYANSTSCYGYADGSIMLVPEGGTGKYHISLGDTEVEGVGSYMFRNLTAGTYSVVIKDALNTVCQLSGYFEVKEPDPIRIRSLSRVSPTCYGGSDGNIAVEAIGGNGGYKYFWPSLNQNGGMIARLAAGAYRLNVTDAKNCFF